MIRASSCAIVLAGTLAACASTGEATMEQNAANELIARSEQQPHAAEVKRLAQPFLDGEWSAGLAIALVDLPHDTVETYGLGRVGAAGSAIPDADTVFEIGSMTKVFTGILLAEASLRGDVSLDQPAHELLPPGVELPDGDARTITLRQLATHTSGLPTQPANLAPASLENPFADYTPALLYAFLSSVTLEATPGSAYAYSNLGAGLLGDLLAARAGRTYGALVDEQIARPLRMSRTGLALPATNVAEGHDAEGTAVSPWDFASLAGAGALRSSIHDLVRFARANLDETSSAPGPALSPGLALAREVHTTAPLPPIGLGWHIGVGPGELARIRWHNGQTGGFHSFLGLDTSRKQAVIVLANQAQMRIDELAIALLKTLRGEPAEAINLPGVVPVDEPTLASYVGEYALAPTFSIKVTTSEGRLYIQATGQQRFRVYPESTTSFYLRAVPAKVSFRTSGDGPATALVLHQGGQELVGERVP